MGDSRSQPTADLLRRLRSSEPLPACPFDRISPLYLTMPDDKPCPFCGQENTTEGPDKCRGADTRIFGEAADRIEELEAALLAIKAKTEGNRPTVNEQNAFEHFTELNARLVEIRALSRAALTGTRDLARATTERGE